MLFDKNWSWVSLNLWVKFGTGWEMIVPERGRRTSESNLLTPPSNCLLISLIIFTIILCQRLGSNPFMSVRNTKWTQECSPHRLYLIDYIWILSKSGKSRSNIVKKILLDNKFKYPASFLRKNNNFLFHCNWFC